MLSELQQYFKEYNYPKKVTSIQDTPFKYLALPYALSQTITFDDGSYLHIVISLDEFNKYLVTYYCNGTRVATIKNKDEYKKFIKEIFKENDMKKNELKLSNISKLDAIVETIDLENCTTKSFTEFKKEMNAGLKEVDQIVRGIVLAKYMPYIDKIEELSEEAKEQKKAQHKLALSGLKHYNKKQYKIKDIDYELVITKYKLSNKYTKKKLTTLIHEAFSDITSALDLLDRANCTDEEKAYYLKTLEITQVQRTGKMMMKLDSMTIAQYQELTSLLEKFEVDYRVKNL